MTPVMHQSVIHTTPTSRSHGRVWLTRYRIPASLRTVKSKFRTMCAWIAYTAST